MKILVVNQYYPPDRSATATIVRHAVGALADRGHEVTVVAGRPSYETLETHPWRLLRREREADRTILRVGSTAQDRERMRGRVANYLSFVGLATPVALAQAADVVVSMTDPPLAGMVATAVATAKRVPHVYWIQDFHPDFGLATGLVQPSPAIHRWRDAHRAVIRAADEVVVLGQDMADRAVEAGADAAHVHIVHNGTDPGAPVTADQRSHPIAQRIRAGASFVAVHGGNIGYAGAFDTLVEAGRRLGDGQQLVFVGDGASKAAVREQATDVPAVRFVDRLPADEVPYLMAAGDLHVVTVKRGVEGLVVPSKMYGILAAGRPVLVVADERSEPALTVRRHDCGLVADPDDPAAVARAIRWAAEHPVELEQMGARAAEAAGSYLRHDMLSDLATIVENARVRRRGDAAPARP